MTLKPEQIDQINLVNWFHYNYPQYAEDFHHFANERKCSWQEGRLLKSMGVKRGVSDIFLAVPIKDKYGLWIELKVDKGRLKVDKGKLSSEQIAFMERKISRGYEAVAAWGFEAAKQVIIAYLSRINL